MRPPIKAAVYNLTHLFAFSPPIAASANDSVSSRLGHAIETHSLENARPHDHDAAYRQLLPNTINNEHPCLLRSRATETGKFRCIDEGSGVSRRRNRFGGPHGSVGGVFFPVSNFFHHLCSRASGKSVTHLASNDGALGTTTRFVTHRDRFCLPFVKREKLSRPDLPSTDQRSWPCLPDLKAFQRSRWENRRSLFTHRDFAATPCFSKPLRVGRLHRGCVLLPPSDKGEGECTRWRVRSALGPRSRFRALCLTLRFSGPGFCRSISATLS